MTSRGLPLPLLLTLSLLTATAPLSIDMGVPALPVMAADLGTTASATALTLSAFILGMSLGQLVMGSLSDALGRRPLIMIGALVAAVSAVTAALAPTIAVLVVARFVQGVGSGTCIVLARATVPDLLSGRAAAKAYSLLMAIHGVAPILAPVIGGLLLGPAGWRGIFWTLAAINVVQFLVAARNMVETRPREQRTPLSFSGVARNLLFVLRNPACSGYVAAGAWGFGAMFCYISASPFVVQEQMGFTPAQYSLVFAGNSVLLVSASLLNNRLLNRFDAAVLLRFSVVSGLGVMVLLLAATVWTTNPCLILPLLALAVGHQGLNLGNATALATGEVRERAGAAASVFGFAQYAVAALVSPVVGIGENPGVAMGAGMLGCAVISLAGSLIGDRYRTVR